MSAGTAPDPSRTSYYVNDAFYRALIEDFSDWQREERLVRDIALREECRMLLEREARLLDRRLFDEWLTLYAQECLYWMPATTGGGDPRREVANAFDDRRRIEDRIFRLKTGFAWSQVPPSRTVRTVGNVEPFRGAREAMLMVRSNLILSEFRAGETRLYAAWCGHRLARRGAGWEIEAKQINLIDCDQNLRNPSIVF